MNSASDANSFLARGGAWVVLQSVLMTAVIVLGLFCHGQTWPPRDSMIFVGAALLTFAAIFGLKGVAALRGNRTPFPKPREQSELVQSGIYAQVRHPLYTSVMLAGFGWSICLESWPALIVALVQVPFFQAKARREERWLCEKFDGYSDYMKRVPRFIPRLRSIPFGCTVILLLNLVTFFQLTAQ